MTIPLPDITLDVDLRNPGQFFACCGVLELASRMWPGNAANDWREPEGWFEGHQFHLATYAADNVPSISRMLDWLTSNGPIAKRLESDIEYNDKVYPVVFTTKDPLVLDWWLDQSGSTEASNLKFWAAHQHPLQIIHELRQALSQAFSARNDIDYTRLFSVKVPMTTRFGFDPVAAWRPLDVGFAPNEHSHLKATLTSPAIELFAAIGIQRFRAKPHPTEHRRYIYSAWPSPLAASVGSALAASSIGLEGRRFEFEVASRGRFKALSHAQRYREEK